MCLMICPSVWRPIQLLNSRIRTNVSPPITVIGCVRALSAWFAWTRSLRTQDGRVVDNKLTVQCFNKIYFTFVCWCNSMPAVPRHGWCLSELGVIGPTGVMARRCGVVVSSRSNCWGWGKGYWLRISAPAYTRSEIYALIDWWNPTKLTSQELHRNQPIHTTITRLYTVINRI